MQISGSYDLFPQHCIMPSLTHKQHAKEVNMEFKEAAYRLSKQARLKLVKAIKQTIKDIEDEKKGVEKVATSSSKSRHFIPSHNHHKSNESQQHLVSTQKSSKKNKKQHANDYSANRKE